MDIFNAGRKMRVGSARWSTSTSWRSARKSCSTRRSWSSPARGYERAGDLVTLKEMLERGPRPGGGARRRGAGHPAGRRPARPAAPGRRRALIDPRTGYALEKIPRSEVENLVLEEVPDINYQDIGGLAPQIEQIRDAVELPFLHPDLYREHGLKPPKGILLYGPPGCGKTLIAKAVANSLAARAAERAGKTEMKSYFLNIKGPELLDKYVGETERHIRLIFARAREKASEGTPVVVFFDEMDSLFRTRGTGISSDVETTIVPQLLSEIDGVERLDNVIVIGASNREDMIDPAILRPGRLDVKVKIQRPDAEAARGHLRQVHHHRPAVPRGRPRRARRRRRGAPSTRWSSGPSSGCTPRPRRTSSSR